MNCEVGYVCRGTGEARYLVDYYDHYHAKQCNTTPCCTNCLLHLQAEDKNANICMLDDFTEISDE